MIDDQFFHNTHKCSILAIDHAKMEVPKEMLDL